jgi:Clostripain family
MSMLEIVYQLRNETHFIVGSQQTEPGDGWPYDQVLGARNGAPTPERMAREIVRVYMKECRKVGDSNVTQSAVRTDRAEAAVRAWSQLGEALAAALPGEGTSSVGPGACRSPKLHSVGKWLIYQLLSRRGQEIRVVAAVVSFAKTRPVAQRLIFASDPARISLHDQHAAPPGTALPVPLRRPPPPRPREPGPAPAARRVQEDRDPAEAAQERSALLL